MVDGLAGPRKLILNLQWVKLGGILLYRAEPWRLRNWHQITVGMAMGRGGGVQIMVGLKIERLFESLFEKHLQIFSSTLGAAPVKDTKTEGLWTQGHKAQFERGRNLPLIIEGSSKSYVLEFGISQPSPSFQLSEYWKLELYPPAKTSA